MIFDSKGKLFGKVSIIDILIVVIILGVVGGAAIFFKRSKAVSPFAATDNIQVTFYTEEVPNYTAKAINKGDLAKNFETNTEFGHVTGVTIGKAISWSESDKGENVPAPKEGYSSATVTVEGKGIYHDSKDYAGVTFGSSDFFIGRQIILLVGKSTFSCRISDIKKKG